MDKDVWLRIKNAELESCFIIRQAQVVSRWVLQEAKATIEVASYDAPKPKLLIRKPNV